MPGIVTSIKSLIVTLSFDDDEPMVGELVQVDNENKTELFVDRLDTSGRALCLNLRSDLSIKKGMKATRMNKGIEVPLGDATIGRIFDALGEPLDNLPPLDPKQTVYKNILKTSGKSSGFSAEKPEVLETGIKVIDFFTPFVKGRKIGIIGGAGVGKTVLTMELINNVAKTGSGLSFFTGIG